MKYIDADLLRKEIEKNKNMIDGLFTEGDDSVYDGENDAYNRVLRILDSLQQEQDIIVINKKDWEAQEQFRKNKVFGKHLQQEQQDVDLEKEIEDYWIATGWSKVITLGKFKVIARYFYGLGQLNSK